MSACTAVLLNAATTAHIRASQARDRIIALSIAEGAFDGLRSSILSREFSMGSSTTTLLSTGLPGNVTSTSNVQLVSGQTMLYLVTVTVEWTHPTMNQRSGTVTLQTYMVNPDA